MIELKSDENELVFSFPEVHPQARLRISFQRTLRIPDDGKEYPLPPGFGGFPLRKVDEYTKSVPSSWLEHGGILLPMYQSEALWIRFIPDWIAHQGQYPFAVKVAAGKVNAVSGDPWLEGLNFESQDYVVTPRQEWIDGYCVERGAVRQFVAMPLGQGHTAEEQLWGSATHGGLQIEVRPMTSAAFERRFRKKLPPPPAPSRSLPEPETAFKPCSPLGPGTRFKARTTDQMGLAAGGRIRQQLFQDPYDSDEWAAAPRKCFVHIANSTQWAKITGGPPPTKPISADCYNKLGLPWFSDYDESASALAGSRLLKRVKSLFAKNSVAPCEVNESFTPKVIVDIAKLSADSVREGKF